MEQEFPQFLKNLYLPNNPELLYCSICYIFENCDTEYANCNLRCTIFDVPIKMITVLFQSESHYPANRKIIIEAITKALEQKMKGSVSVEVSVTIVGDRKMRQLNKSYRQIDATTDVLSFPQNDPSQQALAPFVESPDGVLRLGDIVLSFPQVVAEAAEENKMVDDMMVFLALHGLDHLLGIHHPE